MKTFWNILKKVGKALETTESIFLGGSLLVMLLLILAATFVRITKVPFVTWSEELARTLMVWMGLIGAAAVMRTGENFSVNAVYASIKNEKVRRVFFVIIQIAMLLFGVLATRFAILVVAKQKAMGQLSPAMQTPMWVSYMVLVIFGFSMTLQSLIYYIPLITGKKKYISDSTLDATKEEGADVND